MPVHQRLRADNPLHMHHAARYTALGDDLEYRSGKQPLRKGDPPRSRRLSGAKLHVNLHGYPSHEWTRPLSGYVPRGVCDVDGAEGLLPDHAPSRRMDSAGRKS